jgi:hypothetical protein
LSPDESQIFIAQTENSLMKGYGKGGLKVLGLFCVFSFGRHPKFGEEIKYLVVIDKVRPFCIETNEMRAILSVFPALARIDTEQVCVRAIKTFPQ